MKDDNNDCVFEDEPLKTGQVNPDFNKNHNSSETSHPTDWFKDFLGNKISKTCKQSTNF